MKRPRFSWGSPISFIVCLVLGAALFVVGGPEIKNLWDVLFFAVGMIFLTISTWWRSWRLDASSKELGAVVTFTDTIITAKYSNGEKRSVKWANLSKVGVTTTDEGPMVEDVFWGLHDGEDVRVAYPHAASGALELLAAMQHRLPGFDNETLIHAMGLCENNHFVVWRSVNTDTFFH